MVTTSRPGVPRPLALVVAGVVVGLTVHRLSGTGIGLVAVLLVLAAASVVVVRRDRRARRAEAAREAERPSGRQGPTEGAGRRRRVRAGDLQVSLWFFYGLYPAGYLGGQGWRAVVVGVVVLVAVTVLVVAVATASRRRSLAAARQAHPGATVVLGGLVDLGSMRLVQWSRAAGADLPFTTGEVALVADADGLAVVRAGRAGAPVHRWGWDEVELSGEEHPEVSLLVLTLLGPVPAPRARAVAVTRRRFEVSLAVRDPAPGAALLSVPSAAVDAAVAALGSRRPASAGASAGTDR